MQRLVHEISSFSEVLYKRDVPKNFSQSSSLKQASGGALSKDVLRNFAKCTSLLESFFLTKLQGGNLKLSEAATVDVHKIRCY